MDVIASTAFGLKVHSQTDRNNQFVAMTKKAMGFNINHLLFVTSRTFLIIMKLCFTK